MIARTLLSLLVGAALAGPALAQAPVQLYPRTAPAAPVTPAPVTPAPEPARPVPPPAPPPAASPQPLPGPKAPRGIAVTPLPPAPVQPVPVPPAAQAAPRDEVLAVVEGFYAALARGDGEQANAFLVPEKRNRGAFEIAAMTSFYSAMQQPLRVLGVGRLDPDIVRVQYAYTHQSGRRCDGVADVVLHRVGGRPLIERIRALSGC